MMYQTDPPSSPQESLPTMYDLPSEYPNETGVPDEFHIYQSQLLQETFIPPNYSQEEVFTAIDLNLYYDVHHPLRYKRPDWFAVLGNSRLYQGRDLRLSYVMWQEGIAPFIVMELLSPSTEKEDLGQTVRDASQPPTKWEVYERLLRIPYYVLYNRYNREFRAYQNIAGHYQPLELGESGLWLSDVQLGLNRWEGTYANISAEWLRWYDEEGNWILTLTEQRSRAEEETQIAQQEAQIAQQRAEAAERALNAEKAKAEQLAARLRELGIDPDE